MRDIKFRGKCAFSGVWRYGYFYISKGNYIIRDSEDKESIVLKDSVGQFTGLSDKNDIYIYEGDIVDHKDCKGYSSENWEIIFYSGAFWISGLPRKIRIYNIGDRLNDIKVIGNIHDKL